MGQQICIKLASLGCNLAIADVDLKGAQATVECALKHGVQAKAYKVDVSNNSEILKLKKDILSDLGDVDILVNNAGIISFKSIFEQSAEEIERLIKVNLTAVTLVSDFRFDYF